MPQVRDKLWIWAHQAGSHNKQYGIQGLSRITPAEAASYLGVSNVIMVRYNNKPEPPFHEHGLALSSLARVVWSIIGDSSSSGNDLAAVRKLALQFPNICGVIMDDFFQRTSAADGKKELAPYTPMQLEGIRGQLTLAEKQLDLWVVLYAHQLDLPVGEHLRQCDVLTFWTWRAEEIAHLERNFERAEVSFPFCRKVLGCYMYDYGARQLMPLGLMAKQCELGLRWIQEGRIEGMIFLASCICDLEIEAVEWTRRWIRSLAEGNSQVV